MKLSHTFISILGHLLNDGLTDCDVQAFSPSSIRAGRGTLQPMVVNYEQS
jgi:hypothetical protein